MASEIQLRLNQQKCFCSRWLRITKYLIELVHFTVVTEQAPGWVQSRKYRIDNILENIQAYRIATDQLDGSDYHALLEEFGWDASKIAKMVWIRFIRLLAD